MKPDPWSVVEHHASAIARGDTPMTPAQRLALYVTAAPELIDAQQLPPQGDMVWWTAPVPKSARQLVWNNRGDLFLASRVDARIRQLAVAAIPMILISTALTPVSMLLSIPVGVLVGIAVAHAVRQRWPGWMRFGNSVDPAGTARAVDDFVALYERDVPVIAPGEPA